MKRRCGLEQGVYWVGSGVGGLRVGGLRDSGRRVGGIVPVALRTGNMAVIPSLKACGWAVLSFSQCAVTFLGSACGFRSNTYMCAWTKLVRCRCGSDTGNLCVSSLLSCI
jgi:hypothetical protein